MILFPAILVTLEMNFDLQFWPSQSQNEYVESTDRVFKVRSSCYGINKLDTETYGNYGLKRPSGPGVVP